jgi:hypothetical protein
MRPLLTIAILLVGSLAQAQYPTLYEGWQPTRSYSPYNARSQSYGYSATIRPDYSGGATYRDNTGYSYRIRPDYSGGYRSYDSYGNTSRIRPDYSGGYRYTDPYGGTTRIRPDYSGGWRISR